MTPPLRPASPKPCAQCPWRIANQGKRHPGGWYTKRNLRSLWAGLRRGVQMSCHPTDPGNPVPEGLPTVPEGARTSECAGALILQQREFMRAQFETLRDPTNGVRNYRARHPRGLLRDGIAAIVGRALFGGTPLDSLVMSRPNLNEPGIGHPDLVPWSSAEAKEIKDALSDY